MTALVTTLILVGVPGVLTAAETAKLDDADVRTAIESELLLQAGVAFHLIDVEVTEGVATLSGTVHSLLTQERAEEIAEAVRGVRAVVNRIDVKASQRSDGDIRSDVEQALVNDPAADSYEIDVEVDDGTVTLTGQVESFQEKALAATVAKNVKGVTGLENRIAVDYQTDRPNYEIAKEIERRLHWNVRVDSSMVDVAVDGGAVSLSGKVGSAAEKREAAILAWTAGVSSVDSSGLEVVDWLSTDRLREDEAVEVSDTDVRQAVVDAFLYDPRVNSFNPEVRVSDGVVTLTGVVDNLKAKQAAAEDARNTAGVWRVRNFLKVRPLKVLDDQQIAQRIEDALLRDFYTDSYEITAMVDHGEADLYGTVDSYYEKRRATDVASRVAGVVIVDNHLRIESDEPFLREDMDPVWGSVNSRRYPPLAPVADMEIREQIRDQLFWSPFVDADEVTVDVRNGVATLTGTVDSWSERRAAETNAWEGGAETVVNELDVDRRPVGIP